MHFMNPVPIMALVELAKGLHTSQQTYEACKGLAEFLGKQVATSQDRPVRPVCLHYRISGIGGCFARIVARDCH
jgi:hypothetical protein